MRLIALISAGLLMAACSETATVSMTAVAEEPVNLAERLGIGDPYLVTE